MARARYLIKSITRSSDGPQRTLSQLVLRPALTDTPPDYVYYQSDHDASPAAHSAGDIIEVDDRLIARWEGQATPH